MTTSRKRQLESPDSTQPSKKMRLTISDNPFSEPSVELKNILSAKSYDAPWYHRNLLLHEALAQTYTRANNSLGELLTAVSTRIDCMPKVIRGKKNILLPTLNLDIKSISKKNITLYYYPCALDILFKPFPVSNEDIIPAKEFEYVYDIEILSKLYTQYDSKFQLAITKNHTLNKSIIILKSELHALCQKHSIVINHSDTEQKTIPSLKTTIGLFDSTNNQVFSSSLEPLKETTQERFTL